jgi:hypothetical protein
MTLRTGLQRVCSVAFVLAAFAAGASDRVEDPNTMDRSLVVEDMKCSEMVVPQDAARTAGSTIVGFVKKSWKDAGTVAKEVLTTDEAKLDAETGKKHLRDNYRAALKRGNWLPMTAEVAYGRHAHDLMANSLLVRDSDAGRKLYPQADALLEEIEKGIEKSHSYDFQIFIRLEPTLNASALPGGFLYLDAGLLENPKVHDMARFALAHEVGHVLQRHETRELQGLIVDSYDDSRELEKAIKESRKSAEQAVALLKRVKISKDNYVRHTMDQELQADACALRLILNVHPDGKELAASAQAFIDNLPPSKLEPARPAPDFPEVMQEFVTLPPDRHPSSAKRIQTLRDVQGSLLADNRLN